MLAEISPGTQINNRYQIQKILGQGGFGRTYLAADEQRFQELCVLKEFSPSGMSPGAMNKSRELFEREAKILYQLNHPQIPQFLASFTEQGRLFIVQQYIQGQTYAQVLWNHLAKKGRCFSEAAVIQWLGDILPVLDYIHSNNIIHRDISLENVMLSSHPSQPKPMLIDFGVVKEKVNEILQTSIETDIPEEKRYSRETVVGKFGYAPPEQLYMGASYPCSDIYALGVCCIVLLTGKIPSSLIDYSLEWQWRSHTTVSEKLAQILEKMLAEKPAQRYQSAIEVLNELQPLLIFGKNLSLPPTNQPSNISNISNINRNINQQNQDEIPTTITTNSQLISQIPAELPAIVNTKFLDQCRKELSNCAGPIASFIMEDTLSKFPQLTPEQLIEALVAEIPDQKRAQDFKTRIYSASEETKNQVIHQKTNSPVTLEPEFLEKCKQQLTHFIGPFASYIMEENLNKYPNITTGQLVDVLVSEIPDQKRAQEFKKQVTILIGVD
jgi:serine/threonine protein kinase